MSSLVRAVMILELWNIGLIVFTMNQDADVKDSASMDKNKIIDI